MGLDMYLERAPRLPFSIKEIQAIDEYLYCEYKNYGTEMKARLDPEHIEKCRKYAIVSYPDWDTEMKYPDYGVIENVGYWRKANAIHRWFVEQVQDGEDDCCIHNEVTPTHLMELKETCESVLANRFFAEDYLPTEEGFFFGATDYDEWYFDSLRETIEICNRVLNETNFDTHAIYYLSSW